MILLMAALNLDILYILMTPIYYNMRKILIHYIIYLTSELKIIYKWIKNDKLSLNVNKTN